jgi:hypothetical protein
MKLNWLTFSKIPPHKRTPQWPERGNEGLF